MANPNGIPGGAALKATALPFPGADERKNVRAPGLVPIDITACIERDYLLREVFPELRLRFAEVSGSSGTGLHWVSLERAREVLEDARARRAQSDLPRGVPLALSTLIKKLEREIQQQDLLGLSPDPGYDGALKMEQNASCVLAVGTPAIISDPCSRANGARVEIVRPYGVYSVSTYRGEFHTPEGKKITYQPGYVVREAGGEPFFAEAHTLIGLGGEQTYLRLVKMD